MNVTCLHAEVKIGLWFLDISVEYLETWSSFINSIFVVVILVGILLWIPEAYSENLYFLVCLVKELPAVTVCLRSQVDGWPRLLTDADCACHSENDSVLFCFTIV